MSTKVKVSISSLELNTIVANDVFSEDFKLLITKGTFLTEKVLNRLKVFNIEQVYVDQNEEVDNSFRESQEFIEFKNEYVQISDGLHNSFNNIVEKNISEQELVNTIHECVELYKSSNSSFNILNMLHHMRDFSDATFVHSLNVGMIAAIIGRWSKKSQEEELLLMSCGLFHDIGKLTIPKSILDKPGKLTPEEFDIIKKHPTNGYNLLKDLPIDERIKRVALMHHEKMDGSGYPLSLKGNQIDDFARIITIADIYDALTARRVYRGPVCPFDAIEVFEKDGFQLYDPGYMLTFLQNVINSYLHSEVILSNGTHGEIIMVNTNRPSKPTIRTSNNFIDLTKEPQIKITEIVQN